MKAWQLWLFLCCFSTALQAQPSDSLIPNTPPPALDTVELQQLEVRVEKGGEAAMLVFSSERQTPYLAEVQLNGSRTWIKFNKGLAQIPLSVDAKGKLLKIESYYSLNEQREKIVKLLHLSKLKDQSIHKNSIPLWWSILPPLVAILLALLFRQVIIALFAGILVGAIATNGLRFDPYNMMMSFFKVIDTYILGALLDSGHLSVMIFSLLIGAIVAVISRNGGMAGIVQKLSRFATGPRSTQFVTWLLGIAIFFDDYANTLIVGNTMRPVSDKFKISREKLAYIVDSTAAPVAAVAFITTWIGAELGYIGDSMATLEGIEPMSAYSVFLSSLQYSFYPTFTLLFILMVIYTQRDYGPMLKAEKRARQTGEVYDSSGQAVTAEDMEELDPVEGAPLRWINGLLPILVVIFGTLLGLVDTGMQSSFEALKGMGVEVAHSGWGEVWGYLGQLEGESEMGVFRKLGLLIGNSDSYTALLWSSLAALALAIILTVAQRIMNLEAAFESAIMGFKSMLPALLILVLAWSLAQTTEELATADFLTQLLGDSIPPYGMPVIIFILAAVIAFSTGSSWSTMAILYPIAIPMTWTISMNAGMETAEALPVLYNVIAVVLAASVLGDHCSPISDTTILSSLATSCNHIDHVRTQMPYALTVGSVSMLFGYLSTAWNLPFWLCLLLGVGILFAVIQFMGRSVNAVVEEEA